MGRRKEPDKRFAKFGTVSFTATTKVNDFIDHLESGKVMGTRCNGCGRMFFPPRADCFACLASDMEWNEVKGPGRLVTYSRLEYAPVGFEADLPYRIALLDYGETLTPLRDDQWVAVAAFLSRNKFFETSGISRLLIKARMSDLRDHGKGRITESEMRSRVVVEEY